MFALNHVKTLRDLCCTFDDQLGLDSRCPRLRRRRATLAGFLAHLAMSQVSDAETVPGELPDERQWKWNEMVTLGCKMTGL